MTSRAGVDPRRRGRPRGRARRGEAGGARRRRARVAPPIYARLNDGIVEALTAHHQSQPLSEGVPREELREQLFARGHAAVFERALAELAAAGTIVVKDRVALATHRVELTPEEERARAAIERAYRDGGLTPPDAAGDRRRRGRRRRAGGRSDAEAAAASEGAGAAWTCCCSTTRR